MWVANATSRPFYPRERDRAKILQEAGWALGLVLTGAETLAPIGVRFPDYAARSESLYRLSYRSAQNLTCSQSKAAEWPVKLSNIQL